MANDNTYEGPTVDLKKYGIGEYGEIFGSLPEGVVEYETGGPNSQKIMYAERKRMVFNDYEAYFMGGLLPEQLTALGKDYTQEQIAELKLNKISHLNAPSLLYKIDSEQDYKDIMFQTHTGVNDIFAKKLYDQSKDPVRAGLGALWFYPSEVSAYVIWLPKWLTHPEKLFTPTSAMPAIYAGPSEKSIPLMRKPSHSFGDTDYPYEPYTIEMDNDSGFSEGFQFKHELLSLTLPPSYKSAFENMVVQMQDIAELKYTKLNYADFVFTYNQPFDEAEVKNFDFQNAPLYVRHESNYNFFIDIYEAATENAAYGYRPGLSENLKQTPVDLGAPVETLLPNLNISLLEGDSLDPTIDLSTESELNNKDITDLYPAHMFVTFAGKIKGVFKDVLNEKGEKIGESDKGRYFNKWVRAGFNEYKHQLKMNMNKSSNFWAKVMMEKNKNYIFTKEAIARMHKNYGKRFLFPMFNEIEFSTTRSGLADILNETKMSTAILRTIVEGNKGIYQEPPLKPNKFVFDDESQKTPNDGFLWTLEEPSTWYEQANAETKPLSSFILYGTYPAVKAVKIQEVGGENTEFVTVNMQKDWVSSYMEHDSNIFYPKPNLDPGIVDSLVTEQNSQKMILDLTESEELVLSEGADQNPDSDFLKNILLTIFQEKLADYSNTYTRTYRDILLGKTAHNETVFYRIEKLDQDGNFIQNFYFLNSSENEVIKFVDTQVLYAKTYTYNIYAWQAVFGTTYEYVPVEGSFNGTPFSEFNINVLSRPCVKMIEMPYYSFSKTVIDSPPVYPDVNIIPYRGINNKLLINLNSNSGQVEQVPICCFEDQDAEVFRLLQEKRYGHELITGLTDSETETVISEGYDFGSPEFIERSQEMFSDRLGTMPVLFESDDPACFFELYRLEEKPFNYLDFRDKGFKRGFKAKRAPSVSFIDTIEPNKKYYYTFRVKDVHGHSSNPTPIFQVELVDNGGAVYLAQEIVRLAKPDVGETKVPMQRYLAVIPTIQQSRINLEESDSNTSGEKVAVGASAVGAAPTLGTSDERLFESDKIFKIRLTSKTTGKKIDFNLKFRTEHIVTELEDKAAGGAQSFNAEVSTPGTCRTPPVNYDKSDAYLEALDIFEESD
tara:strand:- start:5692 stop:9039 length:3348 start_codon:yes stop_codon:yes gene_type:complete